VINAIVSGNIDVFRGTEINLESSSYAVGALGGLAPGENTMFLTALSARKSRRGRERTQNLQAEVVTQR
jgi:hypothetical protein